MLDGRRGAAGTARIRRVRGSPARLVIALSVAAVLAVFILYTAVAAARRPSCPRASSPATPTTSRSSAWSSAPDGDAHGAGLRFRVKDVCGPSKVRVPVVYHGCVPDLFKVGRHIVLSGQLHGAIFVADSGSLVTKCPSKYAPAKSEQHAELGRSRPRRALLVSFGLVVYALVAGSFAAWKRRRRLALSAQNALLAAFGTTLVAASVLVVALVRRDFTFQYVAAHTSQSLPLGYTLSAFWGGQEGSLLLWLLILTGYSALAVWLNRRSRDLDRLGRAGARRRRRLLRLHALLRLEPVRQSRPRRPTARGWWRACRTRTCSRTRRCSTSATSG